MSEETVLEKPENGTWHENAKASLSKMKSELGEAIEEEKKKIGEEEAAKENQHFEPPLPNRYWSTIVAYIALQVFLSIISIRFMSTVVNVGLPVNVGWMTLLLQSMHFFSSLRSISVDDLAGFTLFGRPWYIPNPGLYIAPAGVMRTIRASRNYKDKRFPGPSDKVFRVSNEQQRTREGGDIPPKEGGFVRPIFVMTGKPQLTERDKRDAKDNERDPLDQQLSVEISYFVRYRPRQRSGGIFRVARSLSAQTEDIDSRILDLVQEQSERDMKTILSKLTPATIIANWDLVNEVFILKLRLAVMRLGIQIDKHGGGGLVDINVSHDTNDAQARVARALFEKQTKVIAAEAEKIRLEREGSGTASAVLAKLTAEADGRKKMKEALEVSGNDILASETTRNILGNTDVILAGAEAGTKDIFSLIRGAQASLARDLKKKEE